MAHAIEQKHHLPANREDLQIWDKDLTPNQQLSVADIRVNLPENIGKKNKDPAFILKVAEKTIANYPEDTIKIYTDGTAFKGALQAGYGVLVEYPDQTRDELCNPSGKTCCIYGAESLAIEAALHHMTTIFTAYSSKLKDIVIFSDYQSVL